MSGIKLDIKWDAQSQAIINNFQKNDEYWKTFMEDLSYKMGETAIEFIKPLTHKSRYYNGNEELANSLKFDTTFSTHGFEMQLEGAKHGNWVDVGNWPSGEMKYRSNGKAWPVGARSSQEEVTFVKGIYGMGHTTPEMPTHFSEKTARELSYERSVKDYSEEYLREYLRELVMRG